MERDWKRLGDKGLQRQTAVGGAGCGGAAEGEEAADSGQWQGTVPAAPGLAFLFRDVYSGHAWAPGITAASVICPKLFPFLPPRITATCLPQ